MATVKLEISSERREDMIVGALEGGSNYWYMLSDEAIDIINEKCTDKEEAIAVKMWQAIKNGATIPVNDLETDEKIGEINMESIKVGEQLMADNYHILFMDLYNENDDADTADAWFQLCTLKEVIYG